MDKKLNDKFFQDLTSGKIDAIIFGSGLSAKNIFKMLTENAPMETLRALINSKVTTVAIGPTTAEALREMDIKVDVIPQNYLFKEALTALARHWEVVVLEVIEIKWLFISHRGKDFFGSVLLLFCASNSQPA